MRLVFIMSYVLLFDVCCASSVLNVVLLNCGLSLGVCLCYCCMPSETYGRNGATPIFRSFYRTTSSTTGGWSRWNILMCFLLCIILGNTV